MELEELPNATLYVLPDRMTSPFVPSIYLGLPGARDGPPVEGDGAARAQQDEPAEPLHLLRPRPHARLRRRRLLRHARQRSLLGAGHAQHLGAHSGPQVPHRDLAQGARVKELFMVMMIGWLKEGPREARGFLSGAWT